MLELIGRKLAGRGPGEVTELILKNIAHAAGSFGPAAAARREADAAFDRRWGTDTAGLVNLTELAVDPARARHGVRYQASGEDVLARALDRLAIDPSGWRFVDYGSGKGRVVLAAARLGFAEAVGVEFSPELHRVAEENGRRFIAAGGATRAPAFVLGDAGAFDPPSGPLLAYLYNPFGPPVLDEVVARLEAKAAGGDPVLVAYLDPQHADRFAADRWATISRTPQWSLLRAG